MKRPKLYIIGTIDWEAYKDFTHQLDKYESLGAEEVCVDLSSGGGDTYVALAFYARIRNSCVPITVTIRGAAHSAASLIVIGANRRLMASEAWMQIHDETDAEDTAYPPEIAIAEAAHSEVIEQQWAKIMSEHSNETQEYFREASRKTTYLSAKDCLKLGLIDEII